MESNCQKNGDLINADIIQDGMPCSSERRPLQINSGAGIKAAAKSTDTDPITTYRKYVVVRHSFVP
jgi:hypothetical protein